MENADVNSFSICHFAFDVVSKDVPSGKSPIYAVQVIQAYEGCSFTWVIPVETCATFIGEFNKAVQECFRQFIENAHEHDGKLNGCTGCAVIAASELN